MRNFWTAIFAGVMLLAAPGVGAAKAQQSAAQAERQKQLADETGKLLQLATELKAAVDKSNKNQMSLEVIRKADDVEKLAHDLKLKMRG